VAALSESTNRLLTNPMERQQTESNNAGNCSLFLHMLKTIQFRFAVLTKMRK